MKVDTFSMSTSTANIQDFNKSIFTHSVIKKPNDLIISNYTLATKLMGIEKININETFENINITLNSKLLGKNYYKGFCIDTLEETLSKLNATGLKLDPYYLTDSIIKRVDITDDILISKRTGEYINSLNHLIAPKFFKTCYDTGIVFKEKLKSQKLYTTFYSKDYHSNQDKKFFKIYPKQLDYFQDRLRMETKLMTGSTVKKHLKTNNLLHILAQDSINLKVLDRLIGKQFEFPLKFETNNYSTSEEKNLIYTNYLNNLYNADRGQMVVHIKNKLSKRTKATYQLKQLDKYLSIINNNRTNSIKDNIEELRASLLRS